MPALAIPAVIWALLTTMWFGFGWLTPVVTVFLSGLPFVVVNIAKATRAVPADLVLMARAFGVPRTKILRHIVAPAVAGSTVAAVRFAIMSPWNGLLPAECDYPFDMGLSRPLELPNGVGIDDVTLERNARNFLGL